MDTILLIVLVNALLATILALAAWLLGRLERWPAIVHSLWLLVLLKLLTPGLIKLPVPVPESWRSDPASRASDESSTLFAFGIDANLDAHPAPSAAAVTAPASRGWTLNVAPPADVERRASMPAQWLAYWKPALLSLWVLGSTIFWTIAGFRIAQVCMLIRGAQPAPASLVKEAGRLAKRLGVARPPGIWFTELPVPPMLWAIFGRPKLLLPLALWNGLDRDQQTTLLVHELAHLRNGDHWVRRLELLALGFYWWHPAAWWARRQLQETEEQRCDAAVVTELPQSTSAYAQTLLDTVAFLSRARSTALLGASSMGQVRILKRRIAMIVQENGSHSWSRSWAWLVLAGGALLLPLLPTQAQTQTEKKLKSIDPPAPKAQKADSRIQDSTLPPRLIPTEGYRRQLQKALAAFVDARNERPIGLSRAREGDDRLQELEKKVEALLKEIQAMRREQSRPPAGQKSHGKLSWIDLQPWGNVRLDTPAFHSGQLPGNNLASLPKGEQKLGGVPFKIGEELLQLGTSIEKPEKIENIKVSRKLGKLYILQATGYIAEDGAEIAKYTIHYDDGTSTTIPVVYGADVLDWWKYPGSEDPTRGKVAWNGENEPARKEFDASIRLYMTTWENPKPDVTISRIDYEVSGETDCLPFCVAMTAEQVKDGTIR